MQLRQSAQNKSLSERLRQIETDLRQQRLHQYFAWLPFDTSRVPTLGDVTEKFGRFRKKFGDFRQLVGLMSGADSLESHGVLPIVLVCCVALVVIGEGLRS